MINKQTVCVVLVMVFAMLLVGCGQVDPKPTSVPLQVFTPTELLPTFTPTLTFTPLPTLRPSRTPFPTNTSVPSLTPVPTDTPTPAIFGFERKDGPFWDDFSDPNSGWDSGSTDDYGFEYKNGAYTIFNNMTFSEVGSSRSRSHTDVSVQVTVKKVEGPNNAYFGVTCRETPTTYYSLTITGEGEYAIYRTTGKDILLLTSGTSSVINKGNSSNRIEGVCKGSTLTLVVNGVEVVSILESLYQSGSYVGLVVGTRNKTGIKVNFDDFKAQSSTIVFE